jgi:hypothetical protein
MRARHAAEAIVRVRIGAVEALIATREKPASAIFAATWRFTSVPLVASAIRNPLSTPYAARSKRSGRNSGSPPDITSTGFATAAIASIRSNARFVVSSRGPSVFCGTARQWRQLKLHAFVVSQNTRRSGGAISVLRQLHEDGIGDGSLDGELRLIAQEHDARERLKDDDRRSRRDPERQQPIESITLIRSNMIDRTARAGRQG